MRDSINRYIKSVEIKPRNRRLHKNFPREDVKISTVRKKTNKETREIKGEKVLNFILNLPNV